MTRRPLTSGHDRAFHRGVPTPKGHSGHAVTRAPDDANFEKPPRWPQNVGAYRIRPLNTTIQDGTWTPWLPTETGQGRTGDAIPLQADVTPCVGPLASGTGGAHGEDRRVLSYKCLRPLFQPTAVRLCSVASGDDSASAVHARTNLLLMGGSAGR